MATQVNTENFETETSQGVVLVDFYADWCGPCRAMTPVLDKLTGAKVVKCDAEKNPELGQKFQVFSIPKFVILKDGKQLSEFVGLQSQSKLQDAINEAAKA